MFKNEYDQDTGTYDPKGKIHQVEYAIEASKQGSCAVAAKSKTHAVMAILKNTPTELQTYPQKVFKVDDHVGIAMSGITADGRSLWKILCKETLTYRLLAIGFRNDNKLDAFLVQYNLHYLRNTYGFDQKIPIGRLVRVIADRQQQDTQKSWKRPFGVGLLITGCDDQGSKVFQTLPNGEYLEYYAIAIGQRFQSAKTYLENNFESFPEASLEELISHALKALQASMQEGKLTQQNCTLSIVGHDTPFIIIENSAIKDYLQLIHTEEPGDVSMQEGNGQQGADTPMEQ